MLMEITKNEGKPHIISYARDDGTITWMHSDDYFVQHDLSHYAIEKELEYKTAFMGMLNDGMDIKDFENREKRKQMTISKEAWYSENMANLFLIEIFQGEFDDFNNVSGEAFKKMEREYDPPVLNEKEINSVRNYLKALLQQWKELPPGTTMSLSINF